MSTIRAAPQSFVSSINGSTDGSGSTCSTLHMSTDSMFEASILEDEFSSHDIIVNGTVIGCDLASNHENIG